MKNKIKIYLNTKNNRQKKLLEDGNDEINFSESDDEVEGKKGKEEEKEKKEKRKSSNNKLELKETGKESESENENNDEKKEKKIKKIINSENINSKSSLKITKSTTTGISGKTKPFIKVKDYEDELNYKNNIEKDDFFILDDDE